MESIVINPRTTDEAKFITTLLEKMNISSKVITDEERGLRFGDDDERSLSK